MKKQHTQKMTVRVTAQTAYNLERLMFERDGSKRLPISEFMGPSTAQMAGNSIVLADVEEKAQEVINKRVEHEITRILNGYGG